MNKPQLKSLQLIDGFYTRSGLDVFIYCGAMFKIISQLKKYLPAYFLNIKLFTKGVINHHIINDNHTEPIVLGVIFFTNIL